MILALAAEKGGVGKTTLAVNLAVWRAKQGRRVLLIDADKKQASASSWVALRMQAEIEPGITCAGLDGDMVASQVRMFAPLYDDIVIDGRGANDPGLHGSLVVAHRCITPAKPGQFDLNSLGNMAELVGLARQMNPSLDAVVVLNQALTNDGDADASGAQEAILASVPNYRLLKVVIHSRKAFSNCARTGRAVMELEGPDSKSVLELDALAQEVWK
jgi:chromosome partitioning protein